MGVFTERSSSQGLPVRQNFIKSPGKFVCIIEHGKEGRAQFKGFDFAVFSTTVLISRPDRADAPEGVTGIMETVDFLFKVGQKGSEQRFNDMVLRASGLTEEQMARVVRNQPMLKATLDAAVSQEQQALRDSVVEVEGRYQTTQETKKQIVACAVTRRVRAKELREGWEKLDPRVREHLSLDGRIEKMIAREESHFANLARF